MILCFSATGIAVRKKRGGAWRQNGRAALRRRASAPSPSPLRRFSFSIEAAAPASFEVRCPAQSVERRKVLSRNGFKTFCVLREANGARR